MREHLERLPAECDRGDAAAAVRGHDDQATAFRRRGIDDRVVGMLIRHMNRLKCDAGCLRCLNDRAKGFLGVLTRACLVLSRRVSIICVLVVNI
jgi:hypothetical protein